jgi:hypothetical protein
MGMQALSVLVVMALSMRYLSMTLVLLCAVQESFTALLASG